jgi:hypothetical protein
MSTPTLTITPTTRFRLNAKGIFSEFEEIKIICISIRKAENNVEAVDIIPRAYERMASENERIEKA